MESLKKDRNAYPVFVPYSPDLESTATELSPEKLKTIRFMAVEEGLSVRRVVGSILNKAINEYKQSQGSGNAKSKSKSKSKTKSTLRKRNK